MYYLITIVVISSSRMRVCGVLPDYNSRDQVQQQDEGVRYYLITIVVISRDIVGVWYYLITIVVISSRMRVCGVLPDYNSRDQQQDDYLITIVVISSRMRVCGII